MSLNDDVTLQRNVSDSEFLVNRISFKLAATAIFAAVGLVLSALNPFGYFTIFGTKINPFAHLINGVVGVLLGPLYAVICATVIAVSRFSFSIGTLYAFPGGIPGALVVGLVRNLFIRSNNKNFHLAALFEPLGTIFIGGSISGMMSVFIPSLSIISTFTLWWLFALSCIPGAILGWVVLIGIKNTHYYSYFQPLPLSQF